MRRLPRLVAVILALSAGVATPKPAAASDAAALPPPTVSQHLALWLTPAAQAALPDPTQPLCDFSFTAGFSQYGFDARGYGVFLFYDWGGALRCQLETDALDVREQMSAPNMDTNPWSLTPIGPAVENSCTSACTAPVSVAHSPYRCNPCFITDPTGTWWGDWNSDMYFTVKFQQPIAPLFQDTSGGNAGQTEDCPGGASDPYTYWCHFWFAFGPSNVPYKRAIGEFCFGNPSVGDCRYAPALMLGSPSVGRGGTAVLRGGVDPDGDVTSYQFAWGTSRSSLTNVTPMSQLATSGSKPSGSWPPPSSSFVSVSATLTGLRPGVRYYYGLVAANRGGRTSTPVSGAAVWSFVAA